MTFKIDKDCILWKLSNEFTLFYFWWGIAPWTRDERIFEFGIGWHSWELWKYKV